ncbi:MAG: hypothetical protein JNJ63_04555 [Hyphomonadaceae bacterium]|nr:hypothetical protein [Hyphomonadaceae bacterium]
MNVKNWTVCLIEPNRYEGQIIVDLLRNAGVDKVKSFTSCEAALDALELYPANIIVISYELAAGNAALWTRAFRRNTKLCNRKAAVFVTSSAFSRMMAEECRHAGANALIGKPISGKVLLATINKVLEHPRPFIEAPNYVGPCRRAGIVTAGAPKQRRKADQAQEAASRAEEGLPHLLAALADAASKAGADLKQVPACETALKAVQDHAAKAGDGPLMRAGAAFALQLQAASAMKAELARPAIDSCVKGIAAIAAMPVAEAAQRERLAEEVRQAVAKVAHRAA